MKKKKLFITGMLEIKINNGIYSYSVEYTKQYLNDVSDEELGKNIKELCKVINK